MALGGHGKIYPKKALFRNSVIEDDGLSELKRTFRVVYSDPLILAQEGTLEETESNSSVAKRMVVTC